MASQGRKSLAAPRPAQEKVYELGKQGRKTGVTLPDSGVRDEHGLEPFKGIFDSPGKGSAASDSSDQDEDSDDADESMDMDIANTPGPEPLALLAKPSQSMRRPTAQARSPALTSLQSPPVRVGQNSPLRRPPPAAAVNGSKSSMRRLNFDATEHGLPKPTGFGAKAAQNGHRSADEDDVDNDEEDDQQEEQDMSQEEVNDFVEESLHMLAVGDDGDDVDEEPEEESEMEPEPAPKPRAAGKQAAVPKNRGRKPTVATNTAREHSDEDPEEEEHGETSEAAVDPTLPAARRRGRPPKGAKAKESPAATSSAGGSATKRRRGGRSSNTESVPEEPEAGGEPSSKRQRVAPASRKPGRKPAAARLSPAAAAAAASSSSSSAIKAKGKRGRPPKRISDDAGGADESMVIVPRPPLPKRGGLVINRPAESDTIVRTRSGRSSFKPLQYWRNERAEFDKDAVPDDPLGRTKNHGHFALRSIKEIVRVEEEELPERRPNHKRGTKKSGRPRRYGGDSEDEEEEPSPWERDPGELAVPVQLWQPEHEFEPPGPDDEVEEDEDIVAVSGSAIRTSEILGSTFRFTKTLSLPFFGTGIVDLPAGAEKKSKNSRKMHMSFFVHTGRVTVTVHNTAFSIGKGGMWFVPRGNYYSIVNEGTKASRIFFAQACEYKRPEELYEE